MAEILRMNDEGFAACIRGASCAFGVFDGVHLGHRFIIGRALDHAAAHGVRCCILTFDRDPDELFARDSLYKLMDNKERIDALARFGADHVAVLTFDRSFASLDAEVFLDSMFGDALPESIHVGEDFRFGAHAHGDVDLLEKWCSPRGVVVDRVSLFEMAGEPVTSTRIRRLLVEGRTEEARALLGR